MFRPSAEINVILNIISSSPRDRIGLLKRDYRKYFDSSRVPVVEENLNGVVVEKKKAIEYLKTQYGFHTSEEANKVLEDAYRDSI